MVTPPALTAATPVGATTTTFFCVRSTSLFSSVVLPVPALPVTKQCLRVCRANCSASSNSALTITENPSSVLGFENIPDGFVAFCPLDRHAREYRERRHSLPIFAHIVVFILINYTTLLCLLISKAQRRSQCLLSEPAATSWPSFTVSESLAPARCSKESFSLPTHSRRRSNSPDQPLPEPVAPPRPDT